MDLKSLSEAIYLQINPNILLDPLLGLHKQLSLIISNDKQFSQPDTACQ